MSALAKLCLNNNVYISGSDEKKSNLTEELKHLGIKIFYGHSKNNISGADLIVYTSAVAIDNVELLEAKKNKIKILERSDFLQEICNGYKNVIAISGTHGKTTTSAMIGNIFLCANLNPTIHIGGECENFNGNLRVGGKEFFITEACEYKKHLLKIPHSVGVILNIEPDHVECYKDYNDLAKTFNLFAEKSKDINIINEKYITLLEEKKNFITFSENNGGNFTANKIKILKDGSLSFCCFKNNNFFGYIRIHCYGRHNVYNALSAIAVADYFKISYKDIFNGLLTFKGIKRRFEYMGKINNQVVIHDYAHHPTEIGCVIDTAKQLFNKPIVVVFQPHTYSRTKFLFNDFVSKLNLADKIVILPTYSAREKKKDGYDAKKLFLCLKKINKSSKYFYSFNKAKNYLSKIKNNVILILGAGDIVNLAKSIKNDYMLKNNTKPLD